MQIATRDSWKNQAMPEARAPLPYARTFDHGEHERVTRGLLPEAMEDKWFIFYEAPWLWFHRSWTGLAIYGVKLRVEGEGSVVEEACVNRDVEQYRSTDLAYDASLLSFLVDRMLLGKEVAFPNRPTVDEAKVSLLEHHVVGRSRTND